MTLRPTLTPCRFKLFYNIIFLLTYSLTSCIISKNPQCDGFAPSRKVPCIRPIKTNSIASSGVGRTLTVGIWTRESRTNSNPTTKLNLSSQSQALKRRNVEIPLLDLTTIPSEDDTMRALYENTIVPLPSSHLGSDELSTIHIYGMQLTSAIHKMMIDRATSKSPSESFYGHLVSKSISDGDGDDSLVGAIGCAAQVLISAPSAALVTENINAEEEQQTFGGIGEEEGSITVLARGSFRFVVKEIIQTFPYVVGIVDELLDEAPDLSSLNVVVDNDDDEDEDEDEDDDDDDDYDMYADLAPSDLVPRTLSAIKAIIDQKLNTKTKPMSPLEEAILEQSNLGMAGISPAGMRSLQQDHVEEMAAIYDIFIDSLIDIAPMPVDRYYAVAIMAAEMAGLGNEVRRKMLTLTDGVQRLRLVLREVEEKISLVQAKKLTEEIVEKNDEGSKDLMVGTPTLPPWASNIKKGVKVEYYWNEEYEWCKGVIVEDPIMIIDEIVLTVQFEDGETHRLPFRADEKARWRPAS